MAPKLVFGAGGIGTTAKSFTFTWDTPDKVSELLSVLKRLDIYELDSAASYPPGNPCNAETLLGESRAIEKGFIIDSKIAAHIKGPQLDDSGISKSTEQTLKLLKADKVRTMYAHKPDKQTSVEDTAMAFHKQYVAGKFERLGLCNYSVAELDEYFKICDEKGYVKPSVVSDCYNALYREPENELIPLLRKHNCAFYAYSPLAGGFLTGKVTLAMDSEASVELDRTRWRGDSSMASYVSTFDKPAMHSTVRGLIAACEAAPPLSPQEVSMRWLMYHSALQDGDAIIFGAKTIDLLESNVIEARKGPLSGAPLTAVEGMWDLVKAHVDKF